MNKFLTIFLASFAISFAAEESPCKSCRTETLSLRAVTESPWLDAAARRKAWTGAYEISDQDGKRLKLDDLIGKPIALTFLYTRCENPNKCPLAAATMAKLQQAVRAAGIENDVKLVVMTYDPEFDSSEQLKAYAAGKGIQCNNSVLMARPEPAGKNALFDELNVSVNFNGGRVNIHGLQLLLVDKAGRLARSFHTLIWENEKVVGELKKLAAE